MRLCEMTKDDFKAKQGVYLRAIGDNARHSKDGEEEVVEGRVTRIAGKYIHVKMVGVHEGSCKFDHTNRFRQYANVGGVQWELLLDTAQIDEEKEASGYIEKLYNAISKRYESNYSNRDCELSLNKLKRICDILDE